MEYERIHEPLPRHQSSGFSPAKLRAMLRGLEKHQRNNGEDTSPEANDSGELDDRRSLECSTSTEMSSNSGHRSRNRAPDDDSFDSESSSSGPPTVKRLTAVAALLPPFSRPTPSKWDDAEKWISSPTSNRTGHAGPSAGTVPKKSALAFTEHGGRPPAVAKVVTDVPTNTGPLVKNSDGLVHSDLLKPAHNASIVDGPTPVVRSVSMRDMGTEMTPIANQEPSRTVTPIIASSPTSSRTPTPQRSQQPVLRLTEHTAAVKAIAWSPHQQGLLVSGGGTADRCIRFWNTANGNVLNSIDTGSQVCNLAWCKNVNELVSTHGYSQNQIMVWKYPSMSKTGCNSNRTYNACALPCVVA